MSLTYYPPTDEFIYINHKYGLYEILSHKDLDYLDSLKEKQRPFTFYELIDIFPTAVPTIKRQLIENIKKGINVKENRIKLSFFNPMKDTNGISAVDIARAREVNLNIFFSRIPSHRKVLCLFHSERNPSMHLYKNSYYCFTCGAHGSTIDIVMKLHNKTFKEAVNFLNGKSG